MLHTRYIASLTIVALCLQSANALAGDVRLATEWNETVLEIAEAEDGFLTLKGLRTVTMMHIAMHDALSSINGEYESFAYGGAAQKADPVVAASQAAFVVATDQYPDQQERLAQLRERWLRDIGKGELQDAGEKLGNAAARAILIHRKGDGWDAVSLASDGARCLCRVSGTQRNTTGIYLWCGLGQSTRVCACEPGPVSSATAAKDIERGLYAGL